MDKINQLYFLSLQIYANSGENEKFYMAHGIGNISQKIPYNFVNIFPYAIYAERMGVLYGCCINQIVGE